MTGSDPAQTIVFFDGICHLCNAFVDFLVRHDHHHRLHFAPLQGQTAALRLPFPHREELGSVVIWHQGEILTKSQAVLMIFRILGGRWRLFAQIAAICPRWLRDLIYDWIAKNRYRWFGMRETCRLPSPMEKSRILD